MVALSFLRLGVGGGGREPVRFKGQTGSGISVLLVVERQTMKEDWTPKAPNLLRQPFPPRNLQPVLFPVAQIGVTLPLFLRRTQFNGSATMKIYMDSNHFSPLQCGGPAAVTVIAAYKAVEDT